MPHSDNKQNEFDHEIHELYRERNARRFSTPQERTLSGRYKYGELLVTLIVATVVSAAVAVTVASSFPPQAALPVTEKLVRQSAPVSDLTGDLYKKLTEATVSIFNLRSVASGASLLEQAYLTKEALGQGLVLSSDGWIVTTQEVVSDAKHGYMVSATDGVLHQVEQVLFDPVAPLAYLKISSSHLTAVPFAEFAELNVGQQVVATAILDQSNSAGVYLRRLSNLLSYQALTRTDLLLSSEQLPDRYLLDQSLPSGSLGAPVFTAQGRAIGLLAGTAGELKSIIPLDNLGNVIDSIFSEQIVRRPTLGLHYVQAAWLTPFLPSSFSLGEEGVVISSSSKQAALVPKGAGLAAGFKEGDKIINVSGERISSRSLSSLLQQYRPGSRVEFLVKRGDQELKISVVLRETTTSANVLVKTKK